MTGRPKALRRTEETILRHQQSPLEAHRRPPGWRRVRPSGHNDGTPKGLASNSRNYYPTSTIVPWKRTGTRPGGGVFGRPGTMTGRPKALRRTEETILRHHQSPLGSAPPPARVAAFDRPGTMTGRPEALRRTEEMITRHQQSSFGNAPPPARVAACYSCLAWLLAGMTPGSGLALLARLID